MKLLAIETSSITCSVALLINQDIKAIDELAPMQQVQKILPTIQTLLQDNKIELSELDALAFGNGPGSFTGVRLAASVMQGLGFALNVPIIPISSLAALAQNAYEKHRWQKIIVCIDARMHEVYWGVFQVNSKGFVELCGVEQISRPEDIHYLENCPGAGNGWEVYRDQLAYQPSLVDVSLLPTARGVALLAQEKFTNKEFVTPENALPNYLRDKVAKKINEK